MSQFVDGLEFGGSGAKRLTVGTHTGNFYSIKAHGETNLEITSIRINGQVAPEWDDLIITPGDFLLFGSDVITEIVVSAGDGQAFKV